MIYFPKLVDLQIFAKNEGVWGSKLDSWQKREWQEQTTELIQLIPLIVDIKVLVTLSVTLLNSIYSTYIYFAQCTLGYRNLLSTFLKNDAFSERLLAYPKKTDVMPPRHASYSRGISQNFFPKIIGVNYEPRH